MTDPAPADFALLRQCRDLIARCVSYRTALCAALDQLHAAHLREARLREQVCELRAEIDRYGCRVFAP